MLYDFDDILIVPAEKTRIDSRSEINSKYSDGMLPLFTAPMDTVVSRKNVDIFVDNNITTIIPRKPSDIVTPAYFSVDSKIWYSYGLKDFHWVFIENTPRNFDAKMYALIDVANGHMPSVENAIFRAKAKYGDTLVIMAGNVANPKTYVNLSGAGADYVRIGIGNGGGCLTTVQTGVGYPMASLIEDTYAASHHCTKPAKIIADGGFKKYSDVIKALYLGADYVMLGSILNKALESVGDTYYADKNHGSWIEPGNLVDQFDPEIKTYFLNGGKLVKKFRGMSTKEVQKSWGKSDVKTSEGVSKIHEVEYTLSGWVENFDHYLRSAMSYTDSLTLDEFIGGGNYKLITQNSFNRFNK